MVRSLQTGHARSVFSGGFVSRHISRLLGINGPELGSAKCYAYVALVFLIKDIQSQKFIIDSMQESTMGEVISKIKSKGLDHA